MIRIEGPDGKGIYTSKPTFCKYIQMQDSRPGAPHPSVWHDEDLYERLLEFTGCRPYDQYWHGEFMRFRCGFKDAATLKRWVHKEHLILDMQEHGFKLKTYSGIIFHGVQQSVIDWDTRVLLKEEDLLDLY
jgi:hypothetical protein